MKNAVIYPATLFLLLLLLPSCKKDYPGNNASAPAQSNHYINANITSGQTYTYSAGSSRTLRVIQQALHYRVSETGTNDGSAIYSYNSLAGYVGSDEVTLACTSATTKSENKSGCPASRDDDASTIITIKLNVTK